MRYPRNCQHQELGPCARCTADFLARHKAMKACNVKGLRIAAAVQHRMTLDDWLRLDSVMSDVTGIESHEPDTGGQVSLEREELPRENRV